MYDGSLRMQTNSPVGFRLFTLTVGQPQIILRLLWTGLRVQVTHADRLVWRRHAGQHSCCWTDNITQRWMRRRVHHQASDGWLVSSFCCLCERETERHQGIIYFQDCSWSCVVLVCISGHVCLRTPKAQTQYRVFHSRLQRKLVITTKIIITLAANRRNECTQKRVILRGKQQLCPFERETPYEWMTLLLRLYSSD